MYEPDSYEEMMAAAYAGNGCISCGASTHTADDCSWEKGMTEERWIYDAEHDNWHLIWHTKLIDPKGPGPDEPTVEYESWCGLHLDGKAKRKSEADIDGWADILHDECYRKSQE